MGDLSSAFFELTKKIRKSCESVTEDKCNVSSSSSSGSQEMMTDEDIYGDLESSIFISSDKKAVSNQESEQRLQDVLKEQEILKMELGRLTKENNAYATNISSLYLTAKTQLDKKNFIIKQLQDKLKTLTIANAQRSTMSRKEIEETLKKCQEAYQETHSQVVLSEIQQTINRMKKKAAKFSSRKKQYKFGNMSLYFHQHQGSFTRSVPVTFPNASSASVKKKTKSKISNSSATQIDFK